MACVEIAFRPMADGDLPLLASWLAAPHVAAWWREPTDLAAVRRRYGPSIAGDDPTEPFVIDAGGESVGMVQRVWMAHEPSWAAAVGVGSDVDLDFLIGEPRCLRRGLGSAALARFASLTFETQPGVEAISSVPQQANIASWRALERAGFARARTLDRLASDDPGDAGPAYVYLRRRPDEGRWPPFDQEEPPAGR